MNKRTYDFRITYTHSNGIDISIDKEIQANEFEVITDDDKINIVKSISNALLAAMGISESVGRLVVYPQTITNTTSTIKINCCTN